MTGPRSAQQWVHWLEVGSGARLIRVAAVVLGVALLSWTIAYKHFRGPLTETTFAQVVVGRQLAEGQGFTTPVNYPQTAAWLRTQNGGLDTSQPFPELNGPPLYAATVAAALRVLPEWLRESLFSSMPTPPDGFAADYLLLVLNIALLWLAAGLTFVVARRLFDPSVGVIAALALILSASIWDQTVAVNGTPLDMVLLLVLFYALVRVDESISEDSPPPHWLTAAGAAGGFLFLADYTAGVVLVVLLAYGAVSFPRAKLKSAVWLIGGFLIVTTPWLSRNVALTGSPVGLAWQDVALKAGDPTAEPATLRAMLSALSPSIDLNKLGNKGLTSIQQTLRDRLWSGGGIFLTAFFVAGALYRFREPGVNRLRWWFVALLGALMVSTAFLNSGEGERLPVVYAAPLIIVFGAGFFAVLVASSEGLNTHSRWVAALLLAVQALPLVHDLIEPRRLHFNFPPYYPGLFVGLRQELPRRAGSRSGWMADVPAGAAWYSHQRVWAQPAGLRDFYAISVDQPIVALVLTPHTLDRPFFSELTHVSGSAGRFGEWAQVYSGLVTGRLPADFPLSMPQKVADNLYLLIDPAATASRGK